MDYDFKSIVTCRFHTTPNVILEVKPYLEVALACANCRRDNRTVIFRNIGARGICTPKSKCIGFPGQLNSIILLSSDKERFKDVSFEIGYNFYDFTDVKYGRQASPGATWARVHYIITCPKCIEASEGSTQTNIVRPWHNYCDCGNLLFSEQENPFEFMNITTKPT